jgi:hypothetical protein
MNMDVDTIDMKFSITGKPQTTASSKSALSGSQFQHNPPNNKYVYSNGVLRKDIGEQN